MSNRIKEKVSIKGIIISDPLYDNTVKYRYSNKQKMENYDLTIRTRELDDIEDCYTLGISLLEENISNHIKFSTSLNSFSSPSNFKIKRFTIGVDTASILIGAESNPFIEEICTGADGFVGDVFQISKPVEKNGKIGYKYCGIIFIGTFDATLNEPKDLIRTLRYNITGKAIT